MPVIDVYTGKGRSRELKKETIKGTSGKCADEA
jgi:phenylpyruvate tautomerase PptA (4-oxalocrotonate tautomerase family)